MHTRLWPLLIGALLAALPFAAHGDRPSTSEHALGDLYRPILPGDEGLVVTLFVSNMPEEDVVPLLAPEGRRDPLRCQFLKLADLVNPGRIPVTNLRGERKTRPWREALLLWVVVDRRKLTRDDQRNLDALVAGEGAVFPGLKLEEEEDVAQVVLRRRTDFSLQGLFSLPGAEWLPSLGAQLAKIGNYSTWPAQGGYSDDRFRTRDMAVLSNDSMATEAFLWALGWAKPTVYGLDAVEGFLADRRRMDSAVLLSWNAEEPVPMELTARVLPPEYAADCAEAPLDASGLSPYQQLARRRVVDVREAQGRTTWTALAPTGSRLELWAAEAAGTEAPHSASQALLDLTAYEGLAAAVYFLPRSVREVEDRIIAEVPLDAIAGGALDVEVAGVGSPQRLARLLDEALDASGNASLTGAGRERLAEELGADLLLVCLVDRIEPTTSFEGRLTRLTPEMGGFYQSEPRKPNPRKYADPDRYRRDMEEYREDLRDYREARRDYEWEYDNREVEWEYALVETPSVRLQGRVSVLRLSDGQSLISLPLSAGSSDYEQGDMPTYVGEPAVARREAMTTRGEDSHANPPADPPEHLAWTEGTVATASLALEDCLSATLARLRHETLWPGELREWNLPGR